MDRNAKNRRFHAAYRSLALAARRLVRATKAAFAVANDMGLLRRFQREEAGSFVTIAGLAMPIFIGFVGLGTEVGLWLNKHQVQQGAADSAAVSAATAYYVNNSITSVQLQTQAQAITATYNLVNGANGVTVTTNRPPLTGNYTTKPGAVEVIVQQTQQRLFSALWNSQPVSIKARAVALVVIGSNGCVLSLDPHASKAVNVSGSAVVTLNGCSLLDNSDAGTALNVGGSSSLTALAVDSVGGISGSNITTTNGIETGVLPAADPYANASFPAPPSSCQSTSPFHNATTLSPGFFCGLKLNSNANVTLNPGIYYIGSGGMSVDAQATLTGNGVTLVFTQSDGSTYGSATINGGATVTLTAMTTGPTAGIAIFGDRNMTNDTSFIFNGGATSQTLSGAIYLPKADVSFSGSANTANACLQLIGKQVTFTGNSNFSINCQGVPGYKPIMASAPVQLVE